MMAMLTTHLTEDTEIRDLALCLPKHNTLIFSDFHLGYEEMLTSRGTLIPRFQFKDTMARLEEIFKKIKAAQKIIINGDLKHEFGIISTQEWREILKLIDYFSKKSEEIIIVKGNHDVKLTPIAQKRNITIVQNYRLGDILIAHGDIIDDESNDKNIKTIIIGHEHPAITIRSNIRAEKFKCFLKGKWKGKTLIVQPSFNVLTEGTDILSDKTHSPYLKSIDNFEVFVVADRILYFGEVKSLLK
mgnify:FL=1